MRTSAFSPHAGTYDALAGKSDYRALFLAVIMQHIEDAASSVSDVHKPEAADRVRQEARDWLLKPNAGFEEVCALASVEPRDVRKIALAKIDAYDSQLQEAAQKPKRRQYYTAFGETHSLDEWSAIKGIKSGTIRSRLHFGLSIEEALTRPIGAHKRKAA